MATYKKTTYKRSNYSKRDYSKSNVDKVDKINQNSMQDGLTLQQMYDINQILMNRMGSRLSPNEIAEINKILAEEGSKSAKMGAKWVDTGNASGSLLDVPEKNAVTGDRINKNVAPILENSSILGMVIFDDKSAMGRTDLNEYGDVNFPAFAKDGRFKRRAVAFTRYTSSRVDPNNKNKDITETHYSPVQVRKSFWVADDGKTVETRKDEAWEFEPWIQSQFVSPSKAIGDAVNRELYMQVMDRNFRDDVSLNNYLENSLMGRRQLMRIRSALNANVKSSGKDDGLTLGDTLMIPKMTVKKVTNVMNYLSSNGVTYELEVKENHLLSAKINTGSGKYDVTLLDLDKPNATQLIGNLTGQGLYLDKPRAFEAKKGDFKKFTNENGVKLNDTAFSDELAPLKLILGKSEVSKTAYDLANKTDSKKYEDFVKGTGGNNGVLTAVYTDADGNRGLVNVSRNSMILDEDVAEDITLSEMIDEVNNRLEDVNLPKVDASKDNGFEGLPLAALSQLYSRETLIQALLKEGIDADELAKSKYDGEVHLVLSDVKPLPAEMFTNANIERVRSLIDSSNVENSIANLGLDDLRVLIEDASKEPELLQTARAEFNNRIGLVDNEAKYHEDDVDLDNVLDTEMSDELSTDTQIEPVKQGLMTAMAGRYASRESINKHRLTDDELSDSQKKWLDAIQRKIASRIGIMAPTPVSENNANYSAYQQALEKYEKDLGRVHVMFDDQHVVHWAVADENDPKMKAINPTTNKQLSGMIGQLFLPDEDGLIELDYKGGSKGYAVAGYNAHVVTPELQRELMLAENKAAVAAGEKPRWSKTETSWKFLRSEDSLPYRIRLSGFDEVLDSRLDELLTRQISLGVDDSLGDNVMLNSMYRGKDTYLTRINNPLILSDKRLVKHLASRVYMDDALFSDSGDKLLGRHLDKDGNLVDLASKYTPESLSGTLFDDTNIAGLGNSHFLSEGALKMMQGSKGQYVNGRFVEDFQKDSPYQKYLRTHPQDRAGLMMNFAENKYHNGDPTDRVSMAGNQQIHADSYVPDTKLALMTFKGYTMDDGSLITEAYAERVAREQAIMVATVAMDEERKGNHTMINDLWRKVNEGLPVEQRLSVAKSGSKEQLMKDVGNAFVKKMTTLSTREGGFKLSAGDKISTFHGNKTTISHVVTREEMQPGQKFEMFGQNPELEVVMPPESIISRLNMGEIQELMDGDVKPVTNNGETVGYMGSTRMINTEIKAKKKMHAYGPGDGRHVGAQLLWMIRSRDDSDVIIDEIYGHNGNAALALVDYLEATGVSVDVETGVMDTGLNHSDDNLNDPEYLRQHNITVIDPTKGSDSDKLLPVNGGYIKLPEPVHLPYMRKGEKTSYLYVLPESLREGQKLPSGTILEQDRTRRYQSIVELIASGKAGDMLKSGKVGNNMSLLQHRVDGLTNEIIASKLGGADGAGNKVSHIRRKVMGATVPNSATAPATNNPELSLDTIEVGPEIYKTLNLKDPNQLVMMWRDPALHAGSINAFKVKLNPNISGVGMNPVIATQFGGDFDGDTYGIYAPSNDPEVQKVLKEQYSEEAYLRDMGKNIEDRKFVQTDVELNTGMDFTAGAVASKVKNSKGYVIENKKMLEDELSVILKKGAYDESYDVVGKVTELWRQSQENNIGADHIDLRSRETMYESMKRITEIGAKGKLAGLSDNMARFDRLSYYDGATSNNLYDHNADGSPVYDTEMRDNVQKSLQERHKAGYLDGHKEISIEKEAAKNTSVAKADREIEKATVAKQLLTATSGQAAIDLNRTAIDLEDATITSRVSEMTQMTTQAALQVKHNAGIVPALNKGIGMISAMTAKGGLDYEEFHAAYQKVFDDMGMSDGYSHHFVDAAYMATAYDENYGDVNGHVENAKVGNEHRGQNDTKAKGELTMVSAPISMMAYNGAKYLEGLAQNKRSLYDGIVSGALMQGLASAYNKRVAEIDRVDEKAPVVTTEVYRQVKTAAQKANREIREKSFEMNTVLADNTGLAKISPDSADVKKAVEGALNTLNNEDAKSYEDKLTVEDAVNVQLGNVIPMPTVVLKQSNGRTTEHTYEQLDDRGLAF